jgi:putative N6-adenine-specific DNA methylase
VYEYQKNGRFFAQAPREWVAEAAEELETLGAASLRPVHRGIHFETDLDGLYGITYKARLATRILVPLLRFRCHAPKYLYKRAREADWAGLIGPDRSFAVFASVANSRMRHSRYASLKLKDAVVDAVREASGRRPDVDRSHPDVWIGLHVENDWATVHLDASGGSLHRRGYRVQGVEAPMQETLAAAVVRLSGWDGSRPLRDPMCGSGTLLCEALMACTRTPSQMLRERFGFERLPEHDPTAWKRVREAADRAVRPAPPGLVSGSDRSAEAVRAARANLERLPHGRGVRVEASDFRDLASLEDAVILCNPPFGVRMGSSGDAKRLYRELGDFLKQRCTGSSAFIYFGDAGLVSAIGLRPAWKRPLKNGGLDGRLARFDLY